MPAGRRLSSDGSVGTTDDATGIKIEHHGQIGEAFQRSDIGDIGYPNAVGRIHIELPIQGVFDHHGRLALSTPGRRL